jgi:DNA-3-methyladenine glycosylase II
MTDTFRMRARGPFSLTAAARFVEGFPAGQGAGGDRLDLAFPAEGRWTTLGVRVTGDLRAEVVANPGGLPPETVRGQVERILSLDVDGSGCPAIGERDPVVGELQRSSGYLRPVLFHSPYEAAAWSVLSARTGHAQAVRLRDALGETFPPPRALLELRELKGLPVNKIPRLHGIAEAALEGRLDREPLLAMEPDAAYAALQELPGIGPFYARLIHLRAVGTTDVATDGEPRLVKAVQERYGRPIADVSDGWRPFRTWTSVLIRAHA